MKYQSRPLAFIPSCCSINILHINHFYKQRILTILFLELPLLRSLAHIRWGGGKVWVVITSSCGRKLKNYGNFVLESVLYDCTSHVSQRIGWWVWIRLKIFILVPLLLGSIWSIRRSCNLKRENEQHEGISKSDKGGYCKREFRGQWCLKFLIYADILWMNSLRI